MEPGKNAPERWGSPTLSEDSNTPLEEAPEIVNISSVLETSAEIISDTNEETSASFIEIGDMDSFDEESSDSTTQPESWNSVTSESESSQANSKPESESSDSESSETDSSDSGS